MSRIDSSAYAALTRCSGRTEMTENCILGHCNNDERAYSRELLDRDGWLETDGLQVAAGCAPMPLATSVRKVTRPVVGR
jgi:hypothetical protein